jgi:phage/plasmid-associated DNA primase
LDKLCGYFPIADGKVINLRTCEIEDRLKTHYFTRTTDRRFLSEPVGGKAEDELDEEFVFKYFGEVLTTKRFVFKEFVLYIFGYTLTGENNMKHFYILQGEKDTGKSLFLHIIEAMMQSFGGFVNDKVFKKSKTDSVHNTEAFALIEKRVAFVTELEEDEKFNEQLIKKISGGDNINIRACGSDRNVLVHLNTVLMLATNEIPSFKETAFAQRMRIIAFKTKFENNEARYRDIMEHVDHFFTMACRYAKKYYDNGMKFADVQEVLDSTKEVIGERDSVGSWLTERFYEVNEDYVGTREGAERQTPELASDGPWRSKKIEVFDSYYDFCVSNKAEPIGRSKFYKRIESLYQLPTYNGTQVWRGIKRCRME